MKKIIVLMTFATCLLLVANAQMPTGAKKKFYAKQTVKMLKKLPLEAQQRVFEYAEREVKVQEAMATKPTVSPTPTTAATAMSTSSTSTSTSTTSVSTTTTTDPHAGHDHSTTQSPPPLPSVTPATSANSDSPEYLVTAERMPKTTIQWDKDSHDFGKIKEGEKVSHRFTFKNTGSNPLLMTMVKPSCGCTATNWTKEELAPGQKGFVDLEFNSAGKAGIQHKSVSVYLNTEPIMQNLIFSGEVVKE